ncbi:hypothetical protein [Burkholderia sp. BCC0405]|uniref:hypothetical protein n=1 Tax=Burkholderia sp. BCC0405 TaxID=2676298 RepID=UPI00158EA0CA|nr:hypothetical protein [Burkholderia sp. BCC0405]
MVGTFDQEAESASGAAALDGEIDGPLRHRNRMTVTAGRWRDDARLGGRDGRIREASGAKAKRRVRGSESGGRGSIASRSARFFYDVDASFA